MCQQNGVDLSPTNSALKARGIKGVLHMERSSLYWRVRVTDSGGERKTKKVPLRLKAEAATLAIAEARIVELSARIQEEGFLPDLLPWDAPKVIPVEKKVVLSVAQGVEAPEVDFWKGKIRTSAAERTWARLKAETDRLPQGAELTMDLLVAVGEQQDPGSRTRQEFLKVAKRVAKLVEMDGTERLDELKTPYEPAVRDVPDDEDIGAFIGVLNNDDTWAWATWALVTYGCRPSEVFSLRPEPNGTAQVLTIKQKGKAPRWRTALELPVSYPRDEDDNFSPPLIPLPYDPKFRPRTIPWEVNSPSEYDSATAKLHTDRWASWLRRNHKTFQLYDFRHAWAIRSIKKNLNASLAAKCMGHDVTTHHRAYHRWLDQSDIAAVAAQLNQAA